MEPLNACCINSFKTAPEVPQASLGFFPFELLYGCHPCGSLDVVHEEWEEGAKDLPISPLAYVTALRDKFKQVSILVQKELELLLLT